MGPPPRLRHVDPLNIQPQWHPPGYCSWARRANQDLVDVHVRRLRDGEEHGARDVVDLEAPVGRVVEERRLVPPGQISVVRMPLPLRSARIDSDIPVTAHFVLEYRLPGSAFGPPPSR